MNGPSHRNFEYTRSIFLSLLMLLSPYSQIAIGASGEEAGEPSANPVLIPTMVDGYSEGVKSALAHSTDLSNYEESLLENTSEWVVITSLEIDSHLSTHSQPDHSTPAPVLEGAFIWTFYEPARALGSLSEGKAFGEIEAFYPLAYEFMETRGGLRTANDSVVELKIGLLADTSGPISQYFDAFESAVHIAMEDLNDTYNGNYSFELMTADSGCDSTTAATSAQALIDAGVIAVVGAFCSGASMGANSVLADAGITMVSPTSTSPLLSDWDDYPHFFRVVPSDGLEGAALATAINDLSLSPAILYDSTQYSQEQNYQRFVSDSNQAPCVTLELMGMEGNFSEFAQDVVEQDCTGVVFFASSQDTGEAVNQLGTAGFNLSYDRLFSSSEGLGMCDYTGNCDSVSVLSPPNYSSELSEQFWSDCNNDTDCQSGIYQAESYDATMLVGDSVAHAMGNSSEVDIWLFQLGDGWEGASSNITFTEEGDVDGGGFDMCTFTPDVDGTIDGCYDSWSLQTTSSDTGQQTQSNPLHVSHSGENDYLTNGNASEANPANWSVSVSNGGGVGTNVTLSLSNVSGCEGWNFGFNDANTTYIDTGSVGQWGLYVDPGANGTGTCWLEAIATTLDLEQTWIASTHINTSLAPVFKIGLLADESGPISAYHAGFSYASNLALDHLNEDFGYLGTFELTEADSGCDGSTAATGATSLADSGVTGVVGAYCSGASMGANSVLSSISIPMISPASSSPDLSNETAYPHFYRLVTGDDIQGVALAEKALSMSMSSVGVVYYDDYGYFSSMADAFTETYGAGEICGSIGFTDAPDYGSLVQYLSDNGCHNITILAPDYELALILEAVEMVGYQTHSLLAPNVVADDFCDSNFGNASFSVCEGLIYLAEEEYTSDLAEAFDAECSNSTICTEGIYTGHTYDATYLMGYAIAMDAYYGYHHVSIFDRLEHSLIPWFGVSGLIEFMDNGDLKASYLVCSIVDGGNNTSNGACDESWTQSETHSEVGDGNPINITFDLTGYNNTTGNPEVWQIHVYNSGPTGTNVSVQLTEETGCYGWIYDLDPNYFYLENHSGQNLTLTLSPGSIGYGDCELLVNATTINLVPNRSNSTIISASGPPTSNTTFSIGLLADQSVAISQYYPGFYFGADLAIQHLNEELSGLYSFELVTGDTGCDGSTAATAAQSLLDSNVTGVVGAYCSGASMGANSVLSAESVPMISPASSSPELSDDTAYPDFFRMVPGDQVQGLALADLALGWDYDNVALVYEEDYNWYSEMAEEFWNAYGYGDMCELEAIGVGWSNTDLVDSVSNVLSSGCDEIVIIGDATFTAEVMDEGASQGSFEYLSTSSGADICSETLVYADCTDLIYLVEANYSSAASEMFGQYCENSTTCSDGIFTAHTYDAVYLMGYAMANQDYEGGNLSDWIPALVEGGWEGASSNVSFMPNGDLAASFEACYFITNPGNNTFFEFCSHTWRQASSPDNDGETESEPVPSGCYSGVQDCTWLPNDPMFDDQWHLLNSGQTNGTPGEDANLPGAWGFYGGYGYSGDGITISIIDDGLQADHPDLQPNLDLGLSWDWCYDVSDPTPWGDNAHGTSAAGVAAAAGNNSLYGIGAAYDAMLAGHLLIACSFSDAMSAGALSAHNNSIDIYSNSWGPSDDGQTLSGPGPLTVAAIENGAMYGRDGLGSIYVWAAGNGLANNDNSNYDGYSNMRQTIAVTAVDHNGQQSWYAEPGANILLAAPSSGDGVGVTTTDITGSAGYDDGNTTDTFGGTSSATPLVSGIIALMLEANPGLTWRDVQHILVESARKNDQNDSSWAENGAGHLVSHKYGFGLVDAVAALEEVMGWDNVPEEHSVWTGMEQVNSTIPDNSTWSTFDINVTGAPNHLESVDVYVNISHSYRGDLYIALESPSGTISYLAEPRADSGSNYDYWRFGTVHNWGEEGDGTWTLWILDSYSGDQGTLEDWGMELHGHFDNSTGDDDLGVGNSSTFTLFYDGIELDANSTTEPFLAPADHLMNVTAEGLTIGENYSIYISWETCSNEECNWDDLDSNFTATGGNETFTFSLGTDIYTCSVTIFVDMSENHDGSWDSFTDEFTFDGPCEDETDIVIELYLIDEEATWESGETLIGDLETDIPSFGTLNDSFSLGEGDFAWISYETDAYSLSENSLVLYCDYCPELHYMGDNLSTAWNHSAQQYIWEVGTFENNSSGSLGPFSGEGNWTLVMNDSYGDGGMVAELEIWDYDPDYLPEGNNSMWISTSNLTVGIDYDMMWITHVDGVLTNSSWSGSNHSYPNPIWTAYSNSSGEFWNLWISFEDCYIEVYVDIFEGDSNSTNWSFAGEELYGMTGPSCTGLTEPYTTLYGWNVDLGYYTGEPETLANGTTQMGWVVDDLQQGIEYNLTWEYRIDDGDWQYGTTLLNSNGSSETVWWNLTIDQYACTIQILTSLQSEFAVYEDSVPRTMQGPCQDPPVAYEELYVYSAEVGWIYEPTELPGGTNEMAWIIRNLVPGESYEIVYHYFHQDQWLQSGDSEFTATNDYEIIYWNLTVDDYHCDLLVNSYLYQEVANPISVTRNFTGPCYEDPIPYVEHLVYDQVLDEWINVPEYLATGSYSMAVIIGDITEGGEFYLDLGSISVTSDGSQYYNTVFSSEESSTSGCDEDGDGEIDSINMSQEEDCTWDGSFTGGGENATTLYWQMDISEEICSISLNGSLMYQSNDTQLMTTDSLNDFVLGPCQDESSTTTPEFYLYSFVNEGGYYELEPTELSEGTTLMAWLLTNLTGNDYSDFILEYSVTVDGSLSDYNHTANDDYDEDGDGESENEAAFFWYITIQPETCNITISTTLTAANSTHSDELQHQEFEISGPCEEIPVPYIGLYSYDDFSGTYSEIPTTVEAGTNLMTWSMGNLTIGTGYFVSYNVTVDGTLSVTGWSGFTANDTTETVPWNISVDQLDCIVEASYEFYDSSDWSLLDNGSVSLSAPCEDEFSPFVTITSYDESIQSYTPLADSLESGTHLVSVNAANLSTDTSYWLLLDVLIDAETIISNSTGFSVESDGGIYSVEWNLTITPFDCEVIVSYSLYEDAAIVDNGSRSVDGPCEDHPDQEFSVVTLVDVITNASWNLTAGGNLTVNQSGLPGEMRYYLNASVWNATVDGIEGPSSYNVTYEVLIDGEIATNGSDLQQADGDGEVVEMTFPYLGSFDVSPFACEITVSLTLHDDNGTLLDSEYFYLDAPCEDPPQIEGESRLYNTGGNYAGSSGVWYLSNGDNQTLPSTPDPATTTGSDHYIYRYSVFVGIDNASGDWFVDWPTSINASVNVTVDGEHWMSASREMNTSEADSYGTLYFWGVPNSQRWNMFALSPFACEVVIDVSAADQDGSPVYSDSFELPGECEDPPQIEGESRLYNTGGNYAGSSGVWYLSNGDNQTLPSTPDPATTTGSDHYIYRYSVFVGIDNASGDWFVDWPTSINASVNVTVDGEHWMSASREMNTSEADSYGTLYFWGVPNSQRWNMFALSPFACEVVIDVSAADQDGSPVYSDSFELPGECEEDDDGDGIPNDLDSFPLDSNYSDDADGDGVPDETDSFPYDANESVDSDSDGIGDNQDLDDDNDGVNDTLDEFPYDYGETSDNDGDGIGDNQDLDDDDDNIPDHLDAFPLDSNETKDNDGDGIGDNADSDDDGDGVPDTMDAFPLDASEDTDTDGDGVGNSIDQDDDNDGWSDEAEQNCQADPLDHDSHPGDTDADGTCDYMDEDDDGDGIADLDETLTDPLLRDTDGDGYDDRVDAFPMDSEEWVDQDNDGVGDNSDDIISTTYDSANEPIIEAAVAAAVSFVAALGVGKLVFGGALNKSKKGKKSAKDDDIDYDDFDFEDDE